MMVRKTKPLTGRAIAILILASICLVLTAPPSALAGGGGTGEYVWVEQGPAPLGNNIYASSAISNTDEWMVGDNGSVYQCTWPGTPPAPKLTKKSSGTNNDLYGVSAVDTTHIWAVGKKGVIRFYDGMTWSGQQVKEAERPTHSYDLWAVAAINTGTKYQAWAVGTMDGFNHAIILSYDSSVSITEWSVDENYPTGQFCDVKALYTGGNTYVWAVGTDTVSHGRVMFSSGDGNWATKNPSPDIALISLSLCGTSTTQLYGVEWDGTVYSSDDGGENWTPMAPFPVPLHDNSWPAGISASATNNVWVVGWDGKAASWNGSSWTDRTSAGKDLHCVTAYSTSYIYGGGNERFLTSNGSSFATTYGGSELTQYAVSGYQSGTDVHVIVSGEYDATYSSVQVSGDTGDTWSSAAIPKQAADMFMRGVSVINSTNMWICGDRYILYSSDGGVTFTSQYNPKDYLYCISMASTNAGWSGADDAIFYYDPGNRKWNASKQSFTPVYGVSAVDDLTCWAVGSGGKIWKTTNGGQGNTDWTSQISGVTSTLRGVKAYDNNIAWVVGDAETEGGPGTILYTTNGGTTWTKQTNGVPAANLNGVSVVDANTAFVVGASGTILYTTDAGATWTQMPCPVSGNIYGVWAYDVNNIWAVGDGGSIVYADPPYVKAVCPRYAPPGTTLDEAVVYGGWTSFDWRESVVDMGEGVTATPVDNLSNSTTWMACQITVDPGAELGPRTVSVTTGDEVAVPLEGGFVVGDQPTITSIYPQKAAQGMTTDVEITGSATGFSAASTAQFGAGVNINSVRFDGPDKVIANITVYPDAAPGPRDVNVTTGAEVPTALEEGFTVLEQPRVASVSPSVGEPGDTVTITGSGFGNERSYLGEHMISLVEFNGFTGADYLTWTDEKIVVKTAENVQSGSVVVRNLGGASNMDKTFNLKPDNGAWYLAEGTTAWGYKTYVTITNPNNGDVTARITYMTPDGKVEREPLRLPATSQTTIAPANDLPYETDFSTRVECLEGKAIAVDRTMWWTGGGAASPEAHNSIGVNAPSTTWDMAEGCSAYGFETWLLVQNPGNTEATCQVTYMTEGSGVKTLEKKVPANSRSTFNMESDIGQMNASINVASDVPVICERSMYRNNRREGHDSIGVNAPSNNFYLGEGTTAWGFTTYVLVQNPTAGDATVSLTYMTPEGPVGREPMRLPGNSRATIRVNDALHPTDFSTRVSSDKPIVAERAMYWDNGTGEACHDTVGISAPHRVFYLPDGQTSEGRETYTLVQNPNGTAVSVRIDYLAPAGVDDVSFTATIPANSRATFNMADRLPSERASIVVTSLSEGKKIIAERAMYWNGRGVGTSTIGGFDD